MDYENESDADLLLWMSVRDDPKSRTACEAFYRRHALEVFQRTRRAYRQRLGGDQGVEDLVAVTFQQACQRAHTFEPKSEDPKIQGRQVVAWLCRIAKNLFLNMLREQAKLPTVPIPEDLPEPSYSGSEHSSDRLAVAKAVLEHDLDERERTVLLETAEWMDDQSGQSRMPKGVAKNLAARLQTTVDNVRQIRLRALKKFEAKLVQRLQARTAQ